mmetsp:Transcript_4132/g.7115  ORF Transcript_4132/g.7115 Transcript_4132/m.7115 type:complete len:219 (+) Transcript_4132:660-1316(+)
MNTSQTVTGRFRAQISREVFIKRGIQKVIIFCVFLFLQPLVKFSRVSISFETLDCLNQIVHQQQSHQVSVKSIVMPSWMPTSFVLPVGANIKVVLVLSTGRIACFETLTTSKMASERWNLVHLALGHAKHVWQGHLRFSQDSPKQIHGWHTFIFDSSDLLNPVLIPSSVHIDCNMHWTILMHPAATCVQVGLNIGSTIGHSEIPTNHVGIYTKHSLVA